MPKNPLTIGRLIAQNTGVQSATGDTLDVSSDYSGIVITKSLTTATGGHYTITLNCPVAEYQKTLVFTGNVRAVSDTGSPVITSADVTSDGVITITITNVDTVDALDSNVIFAYWLLG